MRAHRYGSLLRGQGYQQEAYGWAGAHGASKRAAQQISAELTGYAGTERDRGAEESVDGSSEYLDAG